MFVIYINKLALKIMKKETKLLCCQQNISHRIYKALIMRLLTESRTKFKKNFQNKSYKL